MKMFVKRLSTTSSYKKSMNAAKLLGCLKVHFVTALSIYT